MIVADKDTVQEIGKSSGEWVLKSLTLSFDPLSPPPPLKLVL